MRAGMAGLSRIIPAAALLATIAACGGGGSTPTPSITLSTTTILFAAQQVGSTSPAAAVTVSNAGTATLTVSGARLAGTDPGDFAETNDCGSVAPGAACTVSVRFHPGATGTLAATLTLSSNASSGDAVITLGGTGVTTATWTTLANEPPEGVQLCLLLTDASLLCQSTAGQSWYRLRPDDAGGYIEGSWSSAASLPASYVPD